MSCACLLSEQGLKDRLVYVNSGGELIFCVKGEKDEIISKDISGDFDATAENDEIGIAAVSNGGALLYFRCKAGNWRKYTILDSRKNGKKINGVHLLKINGRVHAFYCIEYEGRMMLIHHIIDDECAEPSVIDYVGQRCVYDVCADDEFNIHILYADENYRLKYTVFSNSQKRHIPSDFSIDDEIKGLDCIFAKNLCAAYLTREREYNVINCINLADGEKHTVGFGVDAISEPCIFTDGEKVFVQWCEKGYAFECEAVDFKFSKAHSVGQSGGIIELRSPFNASRLFIKHCAASHGKIPLAAAAQIFAKLCIAPPKNFEPMGSEIQKFAAENAKSFETSYPKDVIYDFEKRLSELEMRLDELAKTLCAKCETPKSAPDLQQVGEVDEENLEIFNQMQLSEIGTEKSADLEEEL